MAIQIPIGSWDINANGVSGQLIIATIDANGNISGNSTVFGNPILGFWDEGAQKITFMRIVNNNDPSTHQVYTGYHLDRPSGTLVETLAGSFEAFAGPAVNARRAVFGWTATITLIP